jgi:hypothetical protein
MKPLIANILLVVGMLMSPVGGVLPLQQDSITFQNVKVDSSYPEGITFRIEICGRPANSSVVFHYSLTPDDNSSWSWIEESWTVDEGQTTDNCDKRKFFLRTREDEIPPFAPVRYYWTVTEGSKVSGKSSTYLYSYQDGTYDRQSSEDQGVVIWWHDRPDTFAEEISTIATTAYQDQSAYYAISLDSPITIVIANSPEEFFAWQTEQESIGGIAFYEMYLTIQLVQVGDDYDWINDVIPHEISHIFFNHLVKRYSGASHWLDEGLATYQEYSDHYYEWFVMKDGLEADNTLSLKDLEYDFGDNDEEVDLAYAESYYAVLYMHEYFGKEAVSTLLTEFRKGTSADPAFEKAFGKDTQKFEEDFIVWLKTRLKSPPPNTELQIQVPSPEAANNSYLTVVGIICMLPLCFFVLGAWLIGIAWVLNYSLSVKKR